MMNCDLICSSQIVDYIIFGREWRGTLENFKDLNYCIKCTKINRVHCYTQPGCPPITYDCTSTAYDSLASLAMGDRLLYGFPTYFPLKGREYKVFIRVLDILARTRFRVGASTGYDLNSHILRQYLLSHFLCSAEALSLSNHLVPRSHLRSLCS